MSDDIFTLITSLVLFPKCNLTKGEAQIKCYHYFYSFIYLFAFVVSLLQLWLIESVF